MVWSVFLTLIILGDVKWYLIKKMYSFSNYNINKDQQTFYCKDPDSKYIWFGESLSPVAQTLDSVIVQKQPSTRSKQIRLEIIT